LLDLFLFAKRVHHMRRKNPVGGWSGVRSYLADRLALLMTRNRRDEEVLERYETSKALRESWIVLL